MMRYLAVILFLPWFAVVGFAYWHLPRALARPTLRRVFDWSALLLAMLAASIGASAATMIQWHAAGRIWPQVAAVLFAYAAFLLLLLLAGLARQRIWRS